MATHASTARVPPPALPWLLAVVTILLMLVGTTFLLPTLAHVDSAAWGFPGFGIVASTALMLLGLAIATRRAGNIIGWLFLVAALLAAIQAVAVNYAQYAVVADGAPNDLAQLGSWIDSWIWVPLIILMTTFLFVLFPEGAVAGPRWRWVLRVAGIAGTIAVLAAAINPDESGTTGYRNPFAGPFDGEVVGIAIGLSLLVVVCTMVMGIVGLLIRSRRADGIERKQLQWLFAAGLLVSGAFLFYAAVPSKLGEILIMVGILGIPAAATVAILRYRLWDIDVIVNRALVYVPLTGLLAGVYSIAVAAMQRAFVLVTGEASDAPVILSALILAAVFTPIRNRLQSLVDARFKGNIDPATKLTIFAADLRADYRLADPTRLAARLVSLVRSATGAADVLLELDPGAGASTIQEGSRPLSPEMDLAIGSADRVPGRLLVGARSNARPYRAADVEATKAAAEAVAEAVADFVRATPHRGPTDRRVAPAPAR